MWNVCIHLKTSVKQHSLWEWKTAWNNGIIPDNMCLIPGSHLAISLINNNLVVAIRHNKLIKSNTACFMIELSLTISWIKVHNLKHQWICVKIILKFVTSHRFFYSLSIISFFVIHTIPHCFQDVKSFSKNVFKQIRFY